MDQESVNKGGICWFEVSIDRGKRGLEFWVKTVPQVEEFVKSLGEGKDDSLELYSKDWYSLGDPLKIHRVSKDLKNPKFTMSNPGDVLEYAKNGMINLSFLSFVGVSEPGGVKFGVVGAFSRPYVKELLAKVCKETKGLILDYVTPIHMNLRISSSEL